MKMNMVRFMILIALLVAALPAAVFAAAPSEVGIDVRNRTGGTASLRLTLPNEAPLYLNFQDGTSSFSVPNGVYDFYLSAPCGNLAGQLNFNIAKTMFIDCTPSGPSVGLSRPTPPCDMGLYVIGSPYINGVFYSWKQFGDLIALKIKLVFGVKVHNAQEAAQVWSKHSTDIYYSGCYDGGTYRHP